ncbi:hypothetical protein M3J09_009176 [Ascochyta lentis]
MQLLHFVSICFLALGVYALPADPPESNKPTIHNSIPLEFGREYSKKELDYLRATFVFNATDTIDTQSPRLSKRVEGRSTTLNTNWNCPTGGHFLRSQRATARIINSGNLLATVQWYGVTNIDSWSLPSQRLVGPTVDQRANIATHNFCSMHNTQVCSYKLVSDWRVTINWQFHVFSTSVTMSDFTPLNDVLTETCVGVGAGGSCPTIQDAAVCQAGRRSVVRNA